MTTILATIRDPDKRDVAHVEARREADELAIQIVFNPECRSWQDKLAELNQGKLRLMINGEIYLDRQSAKGKELFALRILLERLSDRELTLAYDTAGVQQGHELKRQIARQQPHNVPFSDLLDIARQSSYGG